MTIDKPKNIHCQVFQRHISNTDGDTDTLHDDRIIIYINFWMSIKQKS